MGSDRGRSLVLLLKAGRGQADDAEVNRFRVALAIVAAALVAGTGLSFAAGVGQPPDPVVQAVPEEPVELDCPVDDDPEVADVIVTEEVEGCEDGAEVTEVPEVAEIVEEELEEPEEVEVEEVEVDDLDGERKVNHGFCVSQAAAETELEGRDRGEHISSVARSDAGKDGVSCEATPVAAEGAAAAGDHHTGKPAHAGQKGRPAHAGQQGPPAHAGTSAKADKAG